MRTSITSSNQAIKGTIVLNSTKSNDKLTAKTKVKKKDAVHEASCLIKTLAQVKEELAIENGYNNFLEFYSYSNLCKIRFMEKVAEKYAEQFKNLWLLNNTLSNGKINDALN